MQRWQVAGWLAVLSSGAWAQTHVVKKPESVVRAVGVYEYTGEEGKPTASRLVPVSIFIDKQLEDAGVYLARPVPFALETGTVFQLEKAGVLQGSVELAYARHLQTGAVAFDDGWTGYGAFKPQPKEVVVAAKKSGPLPEVKVSGGKGPHLTDKSDASPGEKPAADADTKDKKKPVDRSGAAEGVTVSAQGDPQTTDADSSSRHKKADKTADDSDAGSSDGAERPTLKRRTPEERKAAQKKQDQASVVGTGTLNDDPDRPNLHRGKPVTRMEEEDLPPLKGLPKDMKQLIAVSDAKDRPEHDFTRAWASDADRVRVMAAMQAFARARLAAYGAADGARSAVRPAPQPMSHYSAHDQRSRTRRSAATSAPLQAELTDEHLNAYTLSYGGAATYVYTASSPAEAGVVRYVSLVAQQESIGDLKMALSSVTDAAHLDRTPQFRLVDVVDADASNRASLLFELRAQSSRQFALYRVIGAQAEQVFLSGDAP